MDLRARALIVVALLAPASAAACRSRPADLREWRTADHSREDGEAPAEALVSPPRDDDDPFVAAQAVYDSQCSACHGATGRGDGPQAQMARPADFSSPMFQQIRTDEQIRASIIRGRGSMPAFGRIIRPSGIDGLVRLVRSFGRLRDVGNPEGTTQPTTP